MLAVVDRLLCRAPCWCLVIAVFVCSRLVVFCSSFVVNCCCLLYVERVCRSLFVGVVCCLLFVVCCRMLVV